MGLSWVSAWSVPAASTERSRQQFHTEPAQSGRVF
nr:MAG TPA: hypothetical protein [Caudoviricetes sp.]